MISADFETNYCEENNTARVWSAAWKIPGGEPHIDRYIGNFIVKCMRVADLSGLKKFPVWFHNLKFDGEFILHFLYNSKGFNHAYSEKKKKFLKDSEMKAGDFKYMISKEGTWYNISLKTKNSMVVFYDSFKVCPMSLREAGEAFQTKHRKSEMDFSVWMDSESNISEEQEDYIKNDIWVLEEFLEEFQNEGHTGKTIGSCSLKEFQKFYGKYDFMKDFVPVYDKMLSCWISEGDFVNKAYHGAFVYVNPYRKGKIIKNGWTLDVNSLYPYVMHSNSGNVYPYGYGRYWEGDMLYKYRKKHLVSFVHFRCRFRLREGYLPFVHIRNDKRFPANRALECSEVWIPGEGWVDGGLVEFTMQDKEFDVFKKHYDVYDLEIIDGVTYNARPGIFDSYIDYYAKIKQESKGAKRTMAKLFLNNLYGKFAMSQDSSFKVITGCENGILKMTSIEEKEKKPGYIPVGACITSNAMLFTLQYAQRCYHKGEAGFIYSDTDSIHGDGAIPDFFQIHKTELGKWDLEKEWEEGIFIRTKCYVEKDSKGYSITCAGMPKKCKDMFRESIGDMCMDVDTMKKMSEEELEFIFKERSLDDFKPGLKVPGKLRPVRVDGGIHLSTTTFTMKREREWGCLYG